MCTNETHTLKPFQGCRNKEDKGLVVYNTGKQIAKFYIKPVSQVDWLVNFEYK